MAGVRATPLPLFDESGSARSLTRDINQPFILTCASESYPPPLIRVTVLAERYDEWTEGYPLPSIATHHSIDLIRRR